jgi:medium-chain acyl-[acyl-carrier-protein] hydrolase
MSFQIVRPNGESVGPSQESNARWFERLATADTPVLQLYCFPYAGGSAQVFREWRQHLPPQIEVCLVHLPGRGRSMGEPLFRRLRPLVVAAADAMAPGLQGRFAFYGHSMGATISFELARELRRRKLDLPCHLFVSGRQAPTVPESEPPIFDLPHQEFLAAIKRLNGTPNEFFDHPELQELFMPLLRADFEMVDTYEYVPEPPLACPISVYGGEQDIRVHFESLVAWEKQTSAKFSVRMLPGDHFFIDGHKMEFIKAFRNDLFGTFR